MRRWKSLLLALVFGLSSLGFAATADAQRGGRSSGRSHSARSHTYRAPSRGYYRGPRQPSGHYRNGVGSSHKGGTYVNPYTGNRYQKRK